MRTLSALGVLAAVASTACGAGELERAGRAVVVLVEAKPDLRSEVLDRAMPLLLNRVRPGDVLIVASAGDRDRSPELILLEEFSPFAATTDNPLVRRGQEAEHEERHASQLGRVATEVRQALEKAFEDPPEGLALFRSLDLAHRTFATYPEHRPHLVLLSSMVERSDVVDLDREDLSVEREHAVLESLQTQGFLPNLGGVRVRVAGADHRDAGRYAQIRDFWLAYFRAVGAELRPEDYGRTLLRYEDD